MALGRRISAAKKETAGIVGVWGCWFLGLLIRTVRGRPFFFYLTDDQRQNRLVRARAFRWTFLLSVFLVFTFVLPGRAPGHQVASKTLVTAPFSDLAEHWARADVELLRARGGLEGFPDGTFGPDQRLTRAEFVKMLVLSLGLRESVAELKGVQSRFRDVPNDHWAVPYLEAAAERSLVQGDGDGAFRPDADIKRAEAATILAQAFGAQWVEGAAELPFSDGAAVPPWAVGYIASLWRAGLLNGYEDGTWRPLAPISRAEAVTLLVRSLKRTGQAFDLVGDVAGVSGSELVVVVKGKRLTLPLAPGAVFFREGKLVLLGQGGTGSLVPSEGGLTKSATAGTGEGVLSAAEPATQPAIGPLDQVYVVIANGQVQYGEVRYDDLVGELVGVDPAVGTLHLRLKGEIRAMGVPGLNPGLGPTLAPGMEVTLPVRPQAPIFRLGRPASLGDLRPGDRLYLVIDRSRNEIRIIDATP